MIASQDNYQIYPTFGKDIACVPVDDKPSLSSERLDVVEDLEKRVSGISV